MCQKLKELKERNGECISVVTFSVCESVDSSKIRQLKHAHRRKMTTMNDARESAVENKYTLNDV